MKKVISLLLIAVLCFYCTVSASAKESTVLGDVNGDYQVTATDSLLILQNSIAMIPDDAIIYANGILRRQTVMPTSIDAMLALQYSIKMIDIFPVQYPDVEFEDWEESTERNVYCRANHYGLDPNADIISTAEECPQSAYDLLGIDESFFDDNCLFTFKVWEGTSSFHVYLNEMYIKNNHTLYADYYRVFDFFGTCMVDSRQYFVKVSGKLDQITDIELEYVGDIYKEG